MAGKEWQITQKATINGQKISVPFRMFGEKADIQAVCALLAGGYEVKEIVSDMSDLSKADTNVASTNPVSNITMVGPKNQFASIRPFSGVLHFDNTKNVDDIASVLRGMKPFELLPNEKPTKVVVKRSETYAAETTEP